MLRRRDAGQAAAHADDGALAVEVGQASAHASEPFLYELNGKTDHPNYEAAKDAHRRPAGAKRKSGPR